MGPNYLGGLKKSKCGDHGILGSIVGEEKSHGGDKVRFNSLYLLSARREEEPI